MTLDIPSLKQAAESRINNGACLVTVYASTILELIRQHGVMQRALEKIANGHRNDCNHKEVDACRKALEDCK